MCGIFGHFHRGDPQGGDRALVERMAARLAHRGPDGSGVQARGRLAFGAGRLAIIDLAAPAGPLSGEDDSVAVAFNGEIYNFRALRAELEAAGHVFRTHTDTEVIVHGYEQWGADVLARLRGMFAIAVWDAARERLLLARDRLGEKPLYFAERGGDFLFASEIKALFEDPRLPRRVNAEALPFYLTLGYTPPPMTMFEGISKLAPGEMLLVDVRGVRHERYWRPVMDSETHDKAHNGRMMDYGQAVRQVREQVFDAVESRLMSDVPLGALLSGGLDSTAVVAVIGRLIERPVRTFTVGFAGESDKFNVDARYAALAAERLRTEHRAIAVRADAGLAELVPHLIYALDEPMAQPAVVQTAYVAALARAEGVPVLLSGDAGDELFAGYPTYRADLQLQRYRRVPSLVREAVFNPIFERLPGARFDRFRKLAARSRLDNATLRYLSWMQLVALERLPGLLNANHGALGAGALEQLTALIGPLAAAPRTRYFADRIAFTSLNLWLAEDSNMRVDKMSMAMSIESRAPLEDHHLVELALRLPLRYKLRRGDFKAVFKDAVADLVPREVLERPKWGFFPPMSGWLRGPLLPLVQTYLAPARVAAAGWFDPVAVSRLVEDHVVKKRYEMWPLWSALVFHLWHALYISGDLALGGGLTPGDVVARAEITRLTP